jgi:hypothetical protein
MTEEAAFQAALAERRERERRAPETLVTLSFSSADQMLRRMNFTGTVMLNYANGVAREIQFPSSPLRMRLDKTEGQSDSSNT